MKHTLRAAAVHLLLVGSAVAAPPRGPMQSIPSKDGTPIACFVSGKGPPLVLVHGTTADHTRWAPILPALEQRYTVYAIDRRGRGASGDATPYALDREFEDVAAVIDHIGKPTFLLGHSYGAIISLEAALRTPHVAALVLYEPPIPTSGPIVPTELIQKLEARLAAGDREGVLTTFFREVVHMPPTELAMVQRAANWPARVAAAHTIPREERGTNEYHFVPARFAKLSARMLLLQGGDSPAFFRDAIAAVKRAVPSAEVAIMPGQQHVAINSAPELFTRLVLDFLTRAPRR